MSSIISSVQRSFYESCCRGRSRTRSLWPAAAGTVSTAASTLQKAARSVTFFARFLSLLRKNRGKLRKNLAKLRQTGVKARKKTGKLRNFCPKRARFAAILRKKESFSCTFPLNCAHFPTRPNRIYAVVIDIKDRTSNTVVTGPHVAMVETRWTAGVIARRFFTGPYEFQRFSLFHCPHFRYTSVCDTRPNASRSSARNEIDRRNDYQGR